MAYPSFFPPYYSDPSSPDYSNTNPSSPYYSVPSSPDSNTNPSSPYYSIPSSPDSNTNPSSPYYNNNPTPPDYGFPYPSTPNYYTPPSPDSSSSPPSPSSYNNPPGPSRGSGSSSEQEFLDAHNTVRSGLHLGSLTWDHKLASYASDYAAKRVTAGCGLVHSGGPYGENLAEGTDLTASGAVQMWVDEKQYYNHDTNTCADGQVCGHYTQVVWKDTNRVGCAMDKCSDGSSIFVICSYDPRGNYVGQSPY
ncbi:CAP (Cysteine-rich secretory proteins- Antigen 5-and Pathogenesis-related 1 protein) superfamily protein [Striga hermonthica]|uniref:CAP (Cysteine-rich secretory proteins- Antigen 5-and Pathogenesis-related 1 protein) superfamily protein n=1 Tax=Striga hermonthica TaxID=68872 RepID=A0A9N7MJV0_STRHE|nr:CAP (Cysteine-rich secretory proteins- Antigen 5-and Pathogenesis-related 1 protein) superfamily protein [Striga hermonthica]